jgi:hypothetical protein
VKNILAALVLLLALPSIGVAAEDDPESFGAC